MTKSGVERGVYLRSLMGRPYEAGADGPESYDCEGLVRVVWREVFGRVLPGRSDVALVRRAWRVLEQPVDGAVVMMRLEEQHVGVWLAEGGVLHALERVGVVFDNPTSLRVRGFGDPRYYVPGPPALVQDSSEGQS